MRNLSIQTEESTGFGVIIQVPIFCFLLGALLIYMTGISWNVVTFSVPKTLLYGVLLGTGSFILAVLFSRSSAARSLREACKQIRPLFQDMSVLQIIILAISAGISEEVLFRGFLQQWFSGYMSIQNAILFAATIFGLLHFVTLSYFLLATILGSALGLTYYLTGSLLLIITWHAFYDILAILALSRYPELLNISPA